MDCKVTYKPYKKTLDFVQGTATQQILQRMLELKVYCRKVYSGFGKDSCSGRSEVQSQVGRRHGSGGLTD